MPRMMKKRSAYGRRRAPIRKRRYGGVKSRIGVNRSYSAPKNFTETIRFLDVVSPATPSGTDPTITGKAYPMYFQPNILPNLNTVLSGMYKQFCLRGVKIMYQPAFTQYNEQIGTINAPKIYYVEDKISASVDNNVGNLSRMLTQDNVKVFNASRRWSRYVKFPRPLLLQSVVTGTNTTTIVQPVSNNTQWLTLGSQLASAETRGQDIAHLYSRLLVDFNNSLTPTNFVVGTIYLKAYYSVKEQYQPYVSSTVDASGNSV